MYGAGMGRIGEYGLEEKGGVQLTPKTNFGEKEGLGI